MIARALDGYWQELGELGEDPVRTRQGLVAACSVMLATVLALLLEVESPWWAAISAFMSLMSTGAASVRRGILRLIGTAAGAVLGFIMARWLPYDHFALYLFLAATTMLGVIAMQVSPHGLAWLFLSDHVEHGAPDEPGRPDAGVQYRLLPHVRGGDRRHLRHHRGKPAAGLACRPARAGAGLAPPARCAMARGLARHALCDLRHRRAVDLDMDQPAGGHHDGDHGRRGDVGAGDRRWRRGQPARRRRAIAAPLHGLPAGRPHGARLPGAGCDVVPLVACHDRRQRVDRHARTDAASMASAMSAPRPHSSSSSR